MKVLWLRIYLESINQVQRVGYGVKIKPILDTLDLVIVKADHGEGKNWLVYFFYCCLSR